MYNPQQDVVHSRLRGDLRNRQGQESVSFAQRKNRSRKQETWKESWRRKTFWSMFEKNPNTKKLQLFIQLRVHYELISSMYQNIWQITSTGSQNPWTYEMSKISKFSFTAEAFPRGPLLCQLWILQGQPVQYTPDR